MPPRSARKPTLTVAALQAAARTFAASQSRVDDPKLFGKTDGKNVGTYLEKEFVSHLAERYTFEAGNPAKGIDLPGLQIDIKTTRIKKPQSSSPFQSPRQKIFGLGHSLLLFIYQKRDDTSRATSRLEIEHVVYLDESRTADFKMTRGLLQILDNDGNHEDLVAYMQDSRLSEYDIELDRIAREILKRRPLQGFLTLSTAPQWRLHYSYVLKNADTVEGIVRVR